MTSRGEGGESLRSVKAINKLSSASIAGRVVITDVTKATHLHRKYTLLKAKELFTQGFRLSFPVETPQKQTESYIPVKLIFWILH